jgi:sulfite reductase alpha subunit-like flavoprotein
MRAPGAATDNRVFVYEVTGLRQNDEADKNNYPFRSSSNVFIQVPYNRMNEEMRRITRLGGTIVSIRPIEAGPVPAAASEEG